MSQSMHVAAQSNELRYFERLWKDCLQPDLDFGTKIERLFRTETAEFDLDYGFLSRIDPEAETEQFVMTHGPHERLQAGETVPLSTTYCRKTITDPDGTVAISDAPAEGWGGDVAYETFGLDSYLGTTVTVEGELYGTLCFAKEEAREDPFTHEEQSLLEMHGEWVAHELHQWGGPPVADTIDEIAESREISPREIDSMVEALGTQPRRFVLFALLDDTVEDPLEILERTTVGDGARIELRHVHLPKLEQGDFIEWDRDSDLVTRGPEFAAIEPLLRLLDEYSSEFPP